MAIEFLSGLILLVSGYSLYKVRKVHLILNRVCLEISGGLDRQFSQIEALIGLYAELELTKALPSTRGWVASPDFLLELAKYTLDARPKTIVECGSGVSSLVLAMCLKKNGGGHVYSIEHDPKYAEVTRRNLERHGLAALATVVVAPLELQSIGEKLWHWYSPVALAACPASIDMLVIDGPPEATGELARYPAGPILFPRLSSESAIFLDDANRPDETEAVRRWIAESPYLTAREITCEKGCILLMQRPDRHE